MMMRDGNYTGQLRDGVRHGWGEMRYSLKNSNNEKTVLKHFETIAIILVFYHETLFNDSNVQLMDSNCSPK